MLKQLKFLFALVPLLLLSACGGGGGGEATPPSYTTYSGLTTQAMVDSASSQDLGTASASGALQAVAANQASGAFARPVPSPENKLLEISPRIADGIKLLRGGPAAKTINMSAQVCNAGGTAIADTNATETVGSITFNQCGISDTQGGVIYLTGRVDYTYDATHDSVVMAFHVDMTYAGETSGVSMDLACDNFINGPTTCTVSSDFTGLDGRVYRVVEITVSGDASAGFNVSATIYDPDHGYVSLTTSVPLTFNCSNRVPDTGTVTITGSGGSAATIRFVDCSSFTVTIGGNLETFYW